MKISFPYIKAYERRGKIYAYYRRGKTQVRLRGEIGSPEWVQLYKAAHEQYELAHAGKEAASPALPGTFEHLWATYLRSSDFRGLAPRSQRTYRYLIEPMLPVYGKGRVERISGRWIRRYLESLSDKPAKANYWLRVIRVLLQFAVAEQIIAENPARGVKQLKHRATPHRPWTDDEVARMTSPDSPVRIPVLIGLHTGQRLGDVLSLQWSAYQGLRLAVRQAKTDAFLRIPVHPELAAALDAASRTAETICARPDGKPWLIDHFKHSFARVRAEQNLPSDLHFHGLRHSAAARMAEAGCTPAQIAAITGHRTLAMVEHYASGANQERLANEAMKRLRESRVSNEGGHKVSNGGAAGT